MLTCDYRGFGHSSLRNAPHIPTESGLITDAISVISYVLAGLQHPASRTVLLGQSLGSAVTAASALYFSDPSSPHLPQTITQLSSIPSTPESFAGIILVAPFPDLPILLKTYKAKGIFPILSPLRSYPRIEKYMVTKILDRWPTLVRLQSLLSASRNTNTPIHMTILHARNDPEIDFRLSEAVYDGLESSFMESEGDVQKTQERRSVQGAGEVKRGAFAYRSVGDARGLVRVELEVVRYGGHDAVVGFSQVSLAVRRALKGRGD